MANWNGLVMTDKGIALQSKVQAGEVLNITKLKLGSGTLPAETDIRKLTDLIKPEQNLGIGGREPNGDYCKISATISNVGLEAGYYVRELGVFAQDPDDGEILYAYTTDGAPDYLPAEGGSTVISQEFSVNIAVSDTDKINVEIDPGALATMGYIQLQVNEHNEDASAHEKAFSQHNTDETAHYDMTGATSSKAGKRGFAPAPKAGDQNKALFGNGQYQEVIVKTDIMVGATSSKGGTAGLVPVPAAGKQTSFLRGDGTWQTVPQPVIATQAEAEAGTDNTKHMTPLRVKQAINKIPPSFQLQYRSASNGLVGLINSNDDLDDYKIAGTYECNSATIAKTLKNTPYIAGNFRVVVFNNSGAGWGTQLLISNGLDNAIYMRALHTDGSIFTQWNRLTGIAEKLYSINGYEVTNDGLQRVFGSFNITGTGTHTFSKPFPNACLFVLATHYNATDTNNANVSFEASWTTTNVTIRTNDAATAHTYRYMAVGY